MTSNLISKYLPSEKSESAIRSNLKKLEVELSNGGDREIVRILIKANKRALGKDCVLA